MIDILFGKLKNEVVSQKGFVMVLNSHFGILSNGTVVPCCFGFRCKYKFGNIQKSTIKEILQGQRAKEMINGFKNNILKRSFVKSVNIGQGLIFNHL